MSPAWKSRPRGPAITKRSKASPPVRTSTPRLYLRGRRTRTTDRVRRAESFHVRAQAVADTARNLIALEAEDAFLRWEEASLQIVDAREAADAGDKLADDLSKDFTAGLKVKVEDVVNSRVLASQARSQYNEYLYRQILALADLERITGGAFNPHLADAVGTK